MNEILNKLPFSHEDMDEQNYTVSLLQLCSAADIISEKKQAEIRNALDAEFTETAEQYTCRESSTISVKLAQQLYSSVLFRADLYLLSLKDDAKAVETLCTLETAAILERGKALILRLYDDSAKIFRLAYKKRLPFPLHEYRYAMEKAFDEFRRKYSARFDARSCCTSIDYPLLDRPAYAMKSQGAAFICEYYTALMLENEFCSRFSNDELNFLLKGYGCIYNCEYSCILFNIAEIVLNNLLAGMLLKKPLFTILLTHADETALAGKFVSYNKARLCNELSTAFSTYEGAFANPPLFAYLLKHLPVFAGELLMRIKSDAIGRYIVIG